MLLPESPYPPRCGNALRDVQQIKLLQQLGFTIRLLLIRRRGDLRGRDGEFLPSGMEAAYADLADTRESFLLLLWRKAGYLLWSRKHAFAWWTCVADPAEFLAAEAQSRQPAAIVMRSIFIDLLKGLRDVYPGTVVVDCHDADVHLAAEAVRSVRLGRRLGPLANLTAIRRACRSYLPLADELWAVSEQDAARIRRHTKVRRVVVIPSALEDPGAGGAVPGQEPIAVMIANYGYGPNANGARWLIEQVWPLVVRAIPSARLELIGGNMPASLDQQCRCALGCTVYGRVDNNLDAVYRHAAVVLAPLLEGGGTRLKIVEAWSQGKAVLTTTKGIEGLAAPAGCAVVADTAADFARELIALFSDRARRLHLGSCGRRFMRTHLCHSKVLEVMESQSLLAQAP